MSSKELTNLAFKLGGIYILVQTVLYLPTIVSSVYYYLSAPELNEATQFSALIFMATMVVLLVIGILMYTFSGKISKTNLGSASAKSLKNIAIAVAGLVLSVLAIKEFPLIIAEITQQVLNPNFQAMLLIGDVGLQMVLKLLTPLVQLILGLLLFFKVDFFGKLIKVK